MSDFDEATERAIRATRLAKGLDRGINARDKSRPNKAILAQVREADVGDVKKDEKDPSWYLLESKVKAISLLVNIGKFTLGQCDFILNFKRGTCKTFMSNYPEMFQLALRESVDAVLEEFYRNKITVLENLMAGAPNTVKLLKEVQEDDKRPLDVRLKAGQGIFDWTKMILSTKTPEKAKKVLSGDLRQAVDEADDAMGMLRDTLDGAVDGANG